MNTTALRSVAAAQQTNCNTTSWIGRSAIGHQEVSTGQSFVANAAGDLDNIEVYSSVVTLPGSLNMTLHQYNAVEDTWGPSIASASVPVNPQCSGQWISFKMPGLHLDKGASYGFQIQSNDTYVGIGEAAGSAAAPPYSSGKEWRFNKVDKRTDQFSYFSLAFRVGLCA